MEKELLYSYVSKTGIEATLHGEFLSNADYVEDGDLHIEGYVGEEKRQKDLIVSGTIEEIDTLVQELIKNLEDNG